MCKEEKAMQIAQLVKFTTGGGYNSSYFRQYAEPFEKVGKNQDLIASLIFGGISSESAYPGKSRQNYMGVLEQ